MVSAEGSNYTNPEGTSACLQGNQLERCPLQAISSAVIHAWCKLDPRLGSPFEYGVMEQSPLRWPTFPGFSCCFITWRPQVQLGKEMANLSRSSASLLQGCPQRIRSIEAIKTISAEDSKHHVRGWRTSNSGAGNMVKKPDLPAKLINRDQGSHKPILDHSSFNNAHVAKAEPSLLSLVPN